MQVYDSKYGLIKGISNFTLYENGTLHECMLTEYNELVTPHGVFVPQHKDDGVRRKYINSISFFKSGSLKSIALQCQSRVKTPIGDFPAELLTFYESGAIKRLFPLNGKISGYWKEEDEYGLSETHLFNLSSIGFHAKIIGIYFYESGAVKSITFWPESNIQVNHHLFGNIKVRTGISFYADGKIKSLEPEGLMRVQTPIGELTAFDSNCSGINGDNNSLCFYTDGTIKSLVTSTDTVSVSTKGGKTHIHGPGFQPSLVEEEMHEVVPLQIEFYDGLVRFSGNKLEYKIGECNFSIRHYPQYLSPGCSDCSKCNLCG